MCDTDWEVFKQHCYYFSTSKMAFSSAQSECQSMGAELPSIHSKQEQDFIASKCLCYCLGIPSKIIRLINQKTKPQPRTPIRCMYNTSNIILQQVEPSAIASSTRFCLFELDGICVNVDVFRNFSHVPVCHGTTVSMVRQILIGITLI